MQMNVRDVGLVGRGAGVPLVAGRWSKKQATSVEVGALQKVKKISPPESSS